MQYFAAIDPCIWQDPMVAALGYANKSLQQYASKIAPKRALIMQLIISHAKCALLGYIYGTIHITDILETINERADIKLAKDIIKYDLANFEPYNVKGIAWTCFMGARDNIDWCLATLNILTSGEMDAFMHQFYIHADIPTRKVYIDRMKDKTWSEFLSALCVYGSLQLIIDVQAYTDNRAGILCSSVIKRASVDIIEHCYQSGWKLIDKSRCEAALKARGLAHLSANVTQALNI